MSESECSELECDKPVHSKGLCQPHYRQALRRERGLQKPGRKPSPEKPYSRYNTDGTSHHIKGESCINGHKYEEGTYKLSSNSKKVCIICIEDKRPTHCPQGHEYTTENTYTGYGTIQCKTCIRERAPWYKIKSKYGLDLEQYKELLDNQNNLCPVCDTSFDEVRPCVDHNHSCCSGEKTCGKCVRKIICINCNTMLGQAKDNPDILRRGADYLDSFK